MNMMLVAVNERTREIGYERHLVPNRLIFYSSF